MRKVLRSRRRTARHQPAAKKLSFFDLPKEVRDQILDYAIESTTRPYARTTHRLGPCSRLVWRVAPFFDITGLLRVSRQMRREVSKRAFGREVELGLYVYFHCLDTKHDGEVRNFTAGLGLPRYLARSATSLSIDFSAMHYCRKLEPLGLRSYNNGAGEGIHIAKAHSIARKYRDAAWLPSRSADGRTTDLPSLINGIVSHFTTLSTLQAPIFIRLRLDTSFLQASVELGWLHLSDLRCLSTPQQTSGMSVNDTRAIVLLDKPDSEQAVFLHQRGLAVDYVQEYGWDLARVRAVCDVGGLDDVGRPRWAGVRSVLAVEAWLEERLSLIHI